jgi:serine/threonine-protein kinase
VLEGSVRRAGNRLRITAQLIDVAGGYHLWSERYDRELTDVFAIQDEIASAIVSKLLLTMGDRGDAPLVQPPTANIEAYEHFLKGRGLLLQRGHGLRRALESFASAIRLDPNFAAAHAGFAETLVLAAHYGLRPAAEVMPEAKLAVERALAINPQLADAHATRALIALTWDRDRAAAAASWELALGLNPALAAARATYGSWFLGAVEARFAAAETELVRAVELDPLNAHTHGSYGFLLIHTDRSADALSEGRRAVELDPNSFMARWVLQLACDRACTVEEALAAGAEAVQMSGRHPWALGTLASSYAKAGRMTEAESIHDELVARSRREYVQSSILAQTAGFLGRIEEGIRYLGRAETERESALLTLILHWPYLDPLRRHPGYREIVQRIGWA